MSTSDDESTSSSPVSNASPLLTDVGDKKHQEAREWLRHQGSSLAGVRSDLHLPYLWVLLRNVYSTPDNEAKLDAMLSDTSTMAALQAEEAQPWHVLWLIDKGRGSTQRHFAPYMGTADWDRILKDTSCSKSIGDVSFYLEDVSAKITKHIEGLLEPVKQSFPSSVARFTQIIGTASGEQEDGQEKEDTIATASPSFFDDSIAPTSKEDPHDSIPPSRRSRATSTVGSVLHPPTWPSSADLATVLSFVGMTLLSEKRGGSSDE
jgi:hypothetical protein